MLRRGGLRYGRWPSSLGFVDHVRGDLARRMPEVPAPHAFGEDVREALRGRWMAGVPTMPTEPSNPASWTCFERAVPRWSKNFGQSFPYPLASEAVDEPQRTRRVLVRFERECVEGPAALATRDEREDAATVLAAAPLGDELVTVGEGWMPDDGETVAAEGGDPRVARTMAELLIVGGSAEVLVRSEPAIRRQGRG